MTRFYSLINTNTITSQLYNPSIIQKHNITRPGITERGISRIEGEYHYYFTNAKNAVSPLSLNTSTIDLSYISISTLSVT